MFNKKLIFMATLLAIVALTLSQEVNQPQVVASSVVLALNQIESPDGYTSSQPQVAQKGVINSDNSAPPIVTSDSSKSNPHPSEILQNKSSKDAQEQARKIKEEEQVLKQKWSHQAAAASNNLESMTEQQRKQFELKLAEESRQAYQRINKEMEEEKRKHEEEIQRLAKENKLTKSQQILKRQRNQMKQQGQKINFQQKQMDQFLFDIEANEKEQFKISLPISQSIIYFIKIFENNNGVFGYPQVFEDNSELGFYVFQNQNSLVIQNNFYSGTLASFEGKANSSYFFKFVNYGGHKLVSFRLVALLQENHIYDILTVEDVADHGLRMKGIKNAVFSRLQGLQTKGILQKENRKKLTENLSKYYIYSISEIIIMGIVCIVQVQFVQKLLERVSVV